MILWLLMSTLYSTLLSQETRSGSKRTNWDPGMYAVEATTQLNVWPRLSRVDRLRWDTCPYVCPQTGLN